MALEILLADPDKKWLELASSFLKDQMYKVDTVCTGKDAQVRMYKKKYFLVILNYSVEDHTGLQVLKFINSTCTAQKVILVLNRTGMLEADGMDEKKLAKMGVMDVLLRPFDLSALTNVLEGNQTYTDMMSTIPKRDTVSEEEDVTSADNEFSSIKTTEFYSPNTVLFDVYIKLGNSRYVKILHAGDKFLKDRIDKYKQKVDSLYFKSCDRRKYIRFCSYLASKVVGDKRASGSTKVSLLKSVSTQFIDNVFSEGLKPQIIDQGKEICKNIYNVVSKQDDLYKVLRDFQDFDPGSFPHAYLVTLFSSAIIKQFEWQSRATIETTAFACMFHDIGKMKLPKELLDLEPSLMNESQRALYHTHPKLGVEIMEGKREINNSIKQIVMQHHEAYDGTGFPLGIKRSSILTLANIVCLVDDFVRVILENELTPIVALRHLLEDPKKRNRYNSVIIENFIRVFAEPQQFKKM